MSKPQNGTLHESFRPSRDYMLAMLPLIGMAAYLYGPRSVIMLGLAFVTALLCELLTALFRRIPFRASDISGYLTAMTITVMLPASCRYEIVILGTAFAVLLGKNAFGGYGCYPFNPAAMGFAFVSVCWPKSVYMYPKSFSEIGLGLDSGATLYNGIANPLKYGGVPTVDTTKLLLGNYPGPLGTTFCIIIIACLVLLIARGTVTWHIPTSYLAVCAAWAVLFPRINTGIAQSLMYEMLSGAIVFSAVFLATEPTVAPVNPKAKLVYGALLGAGTMIYRTYGVYEMGVCFAILLINPLSSYLDRRFSKKARGAKRL